MVRSNRRRFLYGVATIATSSLLAGCSSDDGDESGGDEAGDETDGDDSSMETETEVETATDTPTSASETVLVGPNAQNSFDPDTLEIEAGTEVTFVWESSGHSLVVDSQPDGADWSGVPETKNSGHEHSKVFEVPGTYDYYCEPHQTFGMEGTITVTEA